MTPGMYVHVPWCPTRCIYCDFNTYVNDDNHLKTRYQAALLREIRIAGQTLDHPHLATIFIGGGTPTTLSPEMLGDIVRTVRDSFVLRPDAEITVEANPGTLAVDYLRAVRQTGINRLSLGVQSFHDDELAFLSRLHRAEAARQAVSDARAAGFDNLSLDLMFNLPDQSVARWRANLEAAVALDPDHLSLYSLIIEPGTPLHRALQQHLVTAPDDDVAAEMYAIAIEVLGAAGYVHYEISNWAKADASPDWQTPALASAHNLIYWRNQSYLGLGAGAYGTIHTNNGSPRGERWMNVKRPQDYIRRMESHGTAQDEKTCERLDPPTMMAEQMLLGLRLIREGVSAAAFEARFGMALQEAYTEAINMGLAHKLLAWCPTPDGPHLRLTDMGRFLANQAILPFID